MGLETAAETTQRDRATFCPRCGGALEGGVCATHGALSWEPRPGNDAWAGQRPWRSLPRLGVVVRALVVALVVAMLAAAVVRTRDLAGDVHELRNELAHTNRTLASFGDDAKADRSALNGLSNRTSSIEHEQHQTPNRAKVASTVEESVFTVETDAGLGSAWVITTSPTLLVTNYHVIESEWTNHRKAVTIKHAERSYAAEVTQVWPDTDLALIRTDTSLPALSVATTRPLVGDSVLVVGSPLGLGGTVSAGIVSSYRTEAGQEFLQFSAPISPGNSGGPVVNDSGQVVGVAVAKYIGNGAEGLSFAIPISRACDALQIC